MTVLCASGWLEFLVRSVEERDQGNAVLCDAASWVFLYLSRSIAGRGLETDWTWRWRWWASLAETWWWCYGTALKKVKLACHEHDQTR